MYLVALSIVSRGHCEELVFQLTTKGIVKVFQSTISRGHSSILDFQSTVSRGHSAE